MVMARGLCEICGKPAELSICKKCGRKVCAEHYNKESGLCTICDNKHHEIAPHGQFVVPEKPTTVNPGDVLK